MLPQQRKEILKTVRRNFDRYQCTTSTIVECRIVNTRSSRQPFVRWEAEAASCLVSAGCQNADIKSTHNSLYAARLSAFTVPIYINNNMFNVRDVALIAWAIWHLWIIPILWFIEGEGSRARLLSTPCPLSGGWGQGVRELVNAKICTHSHILLNRNHTSDYTCTSQDAINLLEWIQDQGGSGVWRTPKPPGARSRRRLWRGVYDSPAPLGY